MIYWFFGYPGVGKDFLAKKLSKVINIPYIDADDFLTPTDKQKLIKGTFAQKDRIRKLKRIIAHINKLLSKHSHLTAADSLPDNLSRNFLLETFKSNIIFIYVTVPKSAHLKQLKERKGHFFKAELLDTWIKKHWEDIQIPYIPFKNLSGDEKKMEKRLLSIYQKSKI